MKFEAKALLWVLYNREWIAGRNWRFPGLSPLRTAVIEGIQRADLAMESVLTLRFLKLRPFPPINIVSARRIEVLSLGGRMSRRDGIG